LGIYNLQWALYEYKNIFEVCQKIREKWGTSRINAGICRAWFLRAESEEMEAKGK
jgi:hypothetical protein